MAETTNPGQQPKRDFGLFVHGICNGFRTYTRRSSGEIIKQLLINLPGAPNSLQVEIPLGTDLSKFKDFEPVSLKITPTFYQGSIIGFSLA